MIKQFTLAAAAATAFIAAPAAAADVIYTSGQTIVLVPGPTGTTASGAFEAVVVTEADDLAPLGADFTATFNFASPFDGLGSASATNISLGGMSNLNFSSILLNGVAGTVINGSLDTAFVEFAPIAFGPLNTLVFNGKLNPPTGVGSAGFGGSVTVAQAVPEPATWAMFILGFGILGAGMRRRNAQVTSAKAALNFA